MLKPEQMDIITKSRPAGWVLEPDAKELLRSAGFDVPDAIVTLSVNEALNFLEASDAPVVAKAVSRKILHKTEHNAVAVGIKSAEQLESEMKRLSRLDGCENIIIEKMVKGIELIIGAKNDFQFGPVIVFGIGGTSVELYNDTAIRMAPLKESDVLSMIDSLKAKDFVYGYRGQSGVNVNALIRMVVDFSVLIMELEGHVESIDLNPVICTEEKCITADARIMICQ